MELRLARFRSKNSDRVVRIHSEVSHQRRRHIVLVASDGINGTELWKSDGTAAGTVLVKNISATDRPMPKV